MIGSMSQERGWSEDKGRRRERPHAQRPEEARERPDGVAARIDESNLAGLLRQADSAQQNAILTAAQRAGGNTAVQRLITKSRNRNTSPVARSATGEVVQRVGPAAVVGAIELGTAVFSAGAPLVLSGNFSSEASTLNYIHERTPPDARWRRATTSFTVYAEHPRLGFGTQHFDFRVTFEYNEYDLRDVNVLGLQSASSELTTSTFQIRFNGLAHTAASEKVAAIRYQISGVWNPVGRGIDTFWGTLHIEASGRGSLSVASERGWVTSGRWGARTDQSLPAPPPPPAPPTPTLHLREISFRPSRASITEAGERDLIAWYDSLPAGAKTEIEAGRLQIMLEGHASTTQPGPANRLLSRRRAEKAREILADIAGSDARFNLRALGEYRAGTADQVESEDERVVWVSVLWAEAAPAGGPPPAAGAP
ncbi:hypothetical protein GCM10009616_29020 [Microlunatus lacustris]